MKDNKRSATAVEWMKGEVGSQMVMEKKRKLAHKKAATEKDWLSSILIQF